MAADSTAKPTIHPSTHSPTSTLSYTTPNHTTESTTPFPPVTAATEDASAGHVLSYIFIPIGSLIFVILVAGLVLFLVRKSRLDKLRHHLMPLYNFDPAEEGEDWESELLEEGTDHRLAAHTKMRVEVGKTYTGLKSPSPSDEPKLSFNRDSGL